MEQLLQTITQKHNLGLIINTSLLNSSQNTVYKVITTQNEYIFKFYTETMDNLKLLEREKQIKVSELFKQNGINVILPIKLSDSYFGIEQNYSYLIYQSYNYQIIENDFLTPSKLVSLSQMIAKSHQIKDSLLLPNFYKKIKINFNKALLNIKDTETKQLLKQSIPFLKALIKECNKDIKYASKYLCINHNDLKTKNILWNDEIPYLIDFDACAKANPYASIIEFAFSITKHGQSINLDFYTYIIKNYLLLNKLDIIPEKVICAAMNGKLMWFKYLLEQNKYDDIKPMLNELNLFFRNKTNLLSPFKN